MILFLDNAESILDPQGPHAQETYAVVEELSELDNICLCVTSRISTIPPACETFDIPTLSIEAARDTFYRIYKKDGQSDLVDGILGQLDFHPLSITLLATVAHHSKWDPNRLSKEWGGRRTDVLRTQHNNSLAATIELSLASPLFQQLGPDARELLGVVAFLPQGIDEKNLDWLFPTLSNRMTIFDTFSILSLTHQSNGFITMLAPLRDYLRPKDLTSSPLLNATKDHYFSRLSIAINPGRSGFEDARWIVSEDVNVEYLLEVFTSINANSVDVWKTCSHFMQHLYWHKRRLVILGPKIESLPDDHCFKPECLLRLARLFDAIGNQVEYKRLLVYTLELQRKRGDVFHIAETLRAISHANTTLGFHKEGLQQLKEALKIYERLNRTSGQGKSWQQLARSLYRDKQLDAAEEAALRAINLLPESSEQSQVCECYRTLGSICQSKGEMVKAIGHFETALGIATRFNWHIQQFWIHFALAKLLFEENKFDDSQAHVEHAKSYAIHDAYLLGRATSLQAKFWLRQRRYEEARSEALRAINLFEKLGAGSHAKICRGTLQDVEEAISQLAGSH